MATGLKSDSSKILFVRPRDDPYVCAVDFMLVFDTDLFLSPRLCRGMLTLTEKWLRG
jgi:hypothetical protein